MATQIGKVNTHLKIFGDYQSFLIDTWKSDDQRPAIYGNAPTGGGLVRSIMEGSAMMCDKCGYVQICFKYGMRDENGYRIPYEVRTGLKHNCDFTKIFPCVTCGSQVYLDKKVLSRDSNKRRALDPISDTYHFCEVKK